MKTHSSLETIFCAPRRHADIGSRKSKFMHEFMVVEAKKASFLFCVMVRWKENLHELKFIAHPPAILPKLNTANKSKHKKHLKSSCEQLQTFRMWH